MIVEKKIWPNYFDLVASGRKKFEIRIADFDIADGDTLVLKEWDPETKDYTGRSIERKVGYVLNLSLDDLYKMNSEEGIKEHGVQIISLEE